MLVPVSNIIFQFHYGTIKRQTTNVDSTRFNDFNSTMVRLKDFGFSGTGSVSTFQFHYGTIKRFHGVMPRAQFGSFQFHYGTIKRMLFG